MNDYERDRYYPKFYRLRDVTQLSVIRREGEMRCFHQIQVRKDEEIKIKHPSRSFKLKAKIKDWFGLQ